MDFDIIFGRRGEIEGWGSAVKPSGLNESGDSAYHVVKEILEQADERQTGDVHFYSPKMWIDRGGKTAASTVLIVTYNAGATGDLLLSKSLATSLKSLQEGLGSRPPKHFYSGEGLINKLAIEIFYDLRLMRGLHAKTIAGDMITDAMAMTEVEGPPGENELKVARDILDSAVLSGNYTSLRHSIRISEKKAIAVWAEMVRIVREGGW
jgi:hypothetical protein